MTPLAQLIEAIRPGVYVKGGDYRPGMVPEAPLVCRLGGTVQNAGIPAGPVHVRRHRTDPAADRHHFDRP
jgi:bifunctional ADP-heptose synthase (sugar kinase/adenylyltransferase)